MFNGAPSGGTGYVGGSLGHAPVNPEQSLEARLALLRIAQKSKPKSKAKTSKSKSALANARKNRFVNKYGAQEDNFGNPYLPGGGTNFTMQGIL